MQYTSIFLMGAVCFSGCTDPKTEIQDSSEVCTKPIAEAGDDLTVALGSIAMLSATGSHWCSTYDDDVTFTWGFVSVPAESVINENSLSANRSIAAVTPQFIPDVVGEYVISLQVNDGVQLSNVDYVVVNVVAGDNPPVANCGGSYQGSIGQLVMLNASASSDPEFASLSYAWSLSGPTCSSLDSTDIYNPSTQKPSFVPDCAGVFVMTLSVSDGNHWSDPAICSIDVAGENRFPIADAGKSAEYGGCADNPLVLNGYGSYDPDGDALTYGWALVSAPTDSVVSNANFSSTADPTPTFSWDVQGQYVFQLQVYDGRVWSAPDLVDISIGDILDNRRPISNAGDGFAVEASANCQNTSYSNECADCAPFTFLLDGSGSRDLDGDTLQYSWSESTGVLSIANPHNAITSATVPTQTVGTSLSFMVTLDVEDCTRQDGDTTIVTYSCVSN